MFVPSSAGFKSDAAPRRPAPLTTKNAWAPISDINEDMTDNPHFPSLQGHKEAKTRVPRAVTFAATDSMRGGALSSLSHRPVHLPTGMQASRASICITQHGGAL
eukprot:12983630-Heterocapsa_arctica.AAC.1